MSICKTCGKKYSKWITPVSARGVCGDCFEAELGQERKAKPPIDMALATTAPSPESCEDTPEEKVRPKPSPKPRMKGDNWQRLKNLALFKVWVTDRQLRSLYPIIALIAVTILAIAAFRWFILSY
jgi:hypothetical protein